MGTPDHFPCRAQIDWQRLPGIGWPVRCARSFDHKGLHQNGWEYQWSDDYAVYPPIPVGRAGQCLAWSGDHQCRYDTGHDPNAEFGAMVHAANGRRWSDPHTDDEWDAFEAMLALAAVGVPDAE